MSGFLRNIRSSCGFLLLGGRISRIQVDDDEGDETYHKGMHIDNTTNSGFVARTASTQGVQMTGY